MDPYEILGLREEASSGEIRNAYRKLAKKYHPDVNSDAQAAEIIAKINAAYEQLTDPEKRRAYDNRFSSVFVEAEPIEEDPVEVYKREFKARKIREARNQARKKAEHQAQWYDFARVLCYPIALFSALVILDYFLPVNTESDYPVYGFQKTYHGKYNTSVVSFMKTELYEFEVPDQMHLDYDYYAEKKRLIFMDFTPIFGTLKKVGVDHGDYRLMYVAPGSIYFPLFLPTPYVLLILSVLFIRKKEYSKTRYALCPIPHIIALVFLVMMISKHV